jgi:hypothetical protein
MRDPPGFALTSEADSWRQKTASICPPEVSLVPRQMRVWPPGDKPAPRGRAYAQGFFQRLVTALLRALAMWLT